MLEFIEIVATSWVWTTHEDVVFALFVDRKSTVFDDRTSRTLKSNFGC